MEWGEFKLGGLFEIKHYGKQRAQEDLQKDGELKYNFVMQNENNNGVIEKVPEQIGNSFNLIPSNSISAFTHLNKVYYQAEPFYSKQGSNVYTLRSEFLNIKTAKFIISAINSIIGNLEYGKNTASRLIEYKIQLPIKNSEIDFDFMESFIADIEAERIAELEAYLLATGLKDYTLTAEEQQVLQDFVNGNFTWDEYKIEDVLQWQSQKEIDPLKLEELKDKTEMIYPFYGQSTINNGIISYHQLTNKVLNNKDGNPTILIHSNNQNIVYLETPFYLKDGHGATSVLQCAKLNKKNQMCIVASIDKVIKNKYSYNHKATKIELKSTVINLPTQNNQPNYAIMETFISAIQKLVIKDVVLYADRKIAR